ncbi:MAG TPA: helix-turn-helix domain-containing protein [Candidatus Paceibacterota bacterium]
MKQEKFFTLKQAAKYLNIGERTLFRYLHNGRVKAAKIGYWRFREKDLKKFIESSFKVQKRKK